MLLDEIQTDVSTRSAGKLVGVRLRARCAPGEDRIVEIRPGKIAIGSSPRCDLQLDWHGVQPLHVLLVASSESVIARRWAADAQLNGKHFDQAELVPGDCLTVGSTCIEFENVGRVADEPRCVDQPTDRVEAGEAVNGDAFAAAKLERSAGEAERTDGADGAIALGLTSASDVCEGPTTTDDREHTRGSSSRTRRVMAALRRNREESRRLTGRVELLEQLLGMVVNDCEVPCQAGAVPGTFQVVPTSLLSAKNENPSQNFLGGFGSPIFPGGLEEVGTVPEDSGTGPESCAETTCSAFANSPEADVSAGRMSAAVEFVANETSKLASLLGELSHDQKLLCAEVESLRHDWAALKDGCDGWQTQFSEVGRQIGELQSILARTDAIVADQATRIDAFESGLANARPLGWDIERHPVPSPVSSSLEPVEQEAAVLMGDWDRGAFDVRQQMPPQGETDSTRDPNYGAVDPWLPSNADPVFGRHDDMATEEYPVAEAAERVAESDWSSVTANRPSESASGAWTADPNTDDLTQDSLDPTSAIPDAPVWPALDSTGQSSLTADPDSNPWTAPSVGPRRDANTWPVMDLADGSHRLAGSDQTSNGSIDESDLPTWPNTETPLPRRGEEPSVSDDELAPFAEFSLWSRGAEASQSQFESAVEESAATESAAAWEADVAGHQVEATPEPAAEQPHPVAVLESTIHEQPAIVNADLNQTLGEESDAGVAVPTVSNVPSPAPTTTSYIEKFAHMFNDDAPTEPRQLLSTAVQNRAGDFGAQPRDHGAAPPRVDSSAEAGHGNDEESIEQYMAKLLQRVRGDSPAAPAAPVHIAPPAREPRAERPQSQPFASTAAARPDQAEPAELQGELAGPASLAGNVDAGRRGIPLAEQAANLETFRALANESARRAIGKHASSVHRRDAVTKAILATLAGLTCVWMMLDAPDWRDLQFITACVSLMVATYWAGQTYGKVIEAFRAASYHGPEPGSVDDPLHPRLPIDVERQ